MKVMFMHENHSNPPKRKSRKQRQFFVKIFLTSSPLCPLTLSYQRIEMHSKCTSRIGTREKVNFISVSTIKSLRCQQFEHDRFISFRISSKETPLSVSESAKNGFLRYWITIYIIVTTFQRFCPPYNKFQGFKRRQLNYWSQ